MSSAIGLSHPHTGGGEAAGGGRRGRDVLEALPARATGPWRAAVPLRRQPGSRPHLTPHAAGLATAHCGRGGGPGGACNPAADPTLHPTLPGWRPPTAEEEEGQAVRVALLCSRVKNPVEIPIEL
jgi:hypothetical protein